MNTQLQNLKKPKRKKENRSVSRCKTPPNGFVINGGLIPPLTTITAQRIFIPKRIYGEISYLCDGLGCNELFCVYVMVWMFMV